MYYFAAHGLTKSKLGSRKCLAFLAARYARPEMTISAAKCRFLGSRVQRDMLNLEGI